jgi:hypothetical protein
MAERGRPDLQLATENTDKIAGLLPQNASAKTPLFVYPLLAHRCIRQFRKNGAIRGDTQFNAAGHRLLFDELRSSVGDY